MNVREPTGTEMFSYFPHGWGELLGIWTAGSAGIKEVKRYSPSSDCGGTGVLHGLESLEWEGKNGKKNQQVKPAPLGTDRTNRRGGGGTAVIESGAGKGGRHYKKNIGEKGKRSGQCPDSGVAAGAQRRNASAPPMGK